MIEKGESFQLSIYTLDGKVLNNETANHHYYKLNVEAFEEGIYLYQLNTSEGVFKGKFIKAH